ncbi:hypothetical protein THAOC_32882 [Thalassiosira oceanica]|uniref:Uncharacterized protein n=1 Tax=Thalassiosira oceanica TaxID=159749 RepID=K0R6A3_THAOC|nr:hypothetical protein THAOC_32882 [Thalassiosira oceanica]|eukprot:EJK48335.1 hypothetical protein THAOC_32882 [Thalassiosira oceanica]
MATRAAAEGCRCRSNGRSGCHGLATVVKDQSSSTRRRDDVDVKCYDCSDTHADSNKKWAMYFGRNAMLGLQHNLAQRTWSGDTPLTVTALPPTLPPHRRHGRAEDEGGAGGTKARVL